MSDPADKPKRAKGRKGTVAPVDRPGRERGKGRYKRVEVDRRATRGAHYLSPVQLRTLDACFDPECSTRTDVAVKAGVGEKTITRWVATHPPFREEYYRRIHARGDEINELRDETIRLSWMFYLSVVRDTTGKYTTEDKFRAAKAAMDCGRAYINQINIQQNVGTPSVPASESGPTAIASVKRLVAAGLSEEEALQRDAQEMRLVIEQIAAGGLQVGTGEDVIDGEVADVPRTD